MIINKSKTQLVILAGGRSKRFGGGYKTLHKFNNLSVLERILNNYKNLDIEVALNVNSNEIEFSKKSNSCKLEQCSVKLKSAAENDCTGPRRFCVASPFLGISMSLAPANRLVNADG